MLLFLLSKPRFRVNLSLNAPHNHSNRHIRIPLLNSIVIQLDSLVILMLCMYVDHLVFMGNHSEKLKSFIRFYNLFRQECFLSISKPFFL